MASIRPYDKNFILKSLQSLIFSLAIKSGKIRVERSSGKLNRGNFTMGILAYLFPFQPIRIQTCKHIVNILYRKAYAGVILYKLDENVFTHICRQIISEPDRLYSATT